jgi:curli biogenesis system outer membrane secretion channel CsgG
MLAQLLISGLLLQVPANSEAAKSSTPQAAPTAEKDANTDDPTALLKVRRIYVESFGDDIISKELQSMIVSSLVTTKRFKVTENRERADAILKGVALEKTSQELHAYGEATSVGGASAGTRR